MQAIYMTIYKQFLKARRQSKARSELVKQFASEKGIATSTAYRWLYTQRRQLSPEGDLQRHPRADKGIPKLYTMAQVLSVKKCLKDKEKTLKEIAKELSVGPTFVSRVQRGDFDKQ